MPRLSAYVRRSHFGGLVSGLFYGENVNEAIDRKSLEATASVGLADDAGGERQDGGRARAVAERFMAQVTASSPPDGDGLGDLAALAGVREYLGRVKCATLAWHALREAIEGS